MKEVIETNKELCVGCNRCVRECPMELANITYQDGERDIKVRIDHTKCINCGRCVAACKHKARQYVDDTVDFFGALDRGLPVSIIAAPSIRSNIPEYKRLFTYLKNRGVAKIFDVSLGADICIWAHIRHIERTGMTSLITQPCPVVVSYCEVYQPGLLEYLSPVQSPMACISIYMKNYEMINGPIAALSPCIAKADEFEDTGLVQYNVTFTKLSEYLDENHVVLPDEETGFDHYDSGIGSLFPMPGGLKENIEAYFGKSLQVSEAEGKSIFEKLKTYADTDRRILPDIFDVLNCSEGCNIGSASLHDKSIFEIEYSMKNARAAATENRGKEYFDFLYKEYDEKLDLADFTRSYRRIYTPHIMISEGDIRDAFVLLGKDTEEKQNVDCGACGSDTCHGMARKIALGLNIPTNCMVRAMEIAREEHTQALLSEQASQAKSVYLSTMSHEIRTPMNAIIGMTSLGIQSSDIERTQYYFSKINDASKHLLGVINDILDISKIEANKLELAQESFSFSEMLQSVVNVSNIRIEERKQQFYMHIDETIPPYFIGDDQRLAQVITNLLSNATKFTPEGGRISFDAGVLPAEGDLCRLRISVADTGIGMTEEQIARLFNAYEQADAGTTRRFGGTGLGLAISKSIVEMMGGAFSVESKPGQGSRFSFTVLLKSDPEGNRRLPGENAGDAGVSRMAAHNTDETEAADFSGHTILLAEDVEINREILIALLEPTKLAVDTAVNGIEAVRMFTEAPDRYSMIFMDLQMPEMDGLQATEEIRALSLPNAKMIPIIAMTANVFRDDIDRCLRAGMNGHLGKPLDMGEVQKTLRAYLARRDV